MNWFPNAQLYERASVELASEASNIFASEEVVPTFAQIMPEQAYLSSYGGKPWRLFVVKAYGYCHAKGVKSAPVLTKLMQNTPEVISAGYSWLPGGKVVPTHSGPFRGVVRYLLPLIVPPAQGPAEKVVITISGCEIPLVEGTGLLFDDTFEHSVENSTSKPRIVLLLDVVRGQLPIPLRITNYLVIRLAFLMSKLNLK